MESDAKLESESGEKIVEPVDNLSQVDHLLLSGPNKNQYTENVKLESSLHEKHDLPVVNGDIEPSCDHRNDITALQNSESVSQDATGIIEIEDSIIISDSDERELQAQCSRNKIETIVKSFENEDVSGQKDAPNYVPVVINDNPSTSQNHGIKQDIIINGIGKSEQPMLVKIEPKVKPSAPKEKPKTLQQKTLLSEKEQLELKCRDLTDQNDSLLNQLDERERFLEDILTDIDEFKEKSKVNLLDVKRENIKLKEVNLSQLNKFSIEREFILKENEFLKQRIEYLNEDLKFYSDRCDKDFYAEREEMSSDETEDSKELKSENAELKIEVESSINLITRLEKSLEIKNSELDQLRTKLSEMEINKNSSDHKTDKEMSTENPDVVHLSAQTVFHETKDSSSQTERSKQDVNSFESQTDFELVEKIRYDHLLADYNDAKEVNESLQNMVVEKIEEIDQSSVMFTDLNQQLEQMRLKNDRIIEESLQSLSEKDKVIEKLSNDVEEKIKALKARNENLDKLQTENKELRKMHDEKVTQIATLQNEIKDLSEENEKIEKVQMQNQEQKEMRDAHLSQISTLQNEIREILLENEQIGKLQTENKEQREALLEHVSQIETLNKEIQELSEGNKNLVQLQKENFEQKEMIDANLSQIAILENEIRKISEENVLFSKLETENQEHKIMLEQKSSHIAELQNEIREILEVKEYLQNLEKTNEKELKELKSNLARVTLELDQKTEELVDLKSQHEKALKMMAENFSEELETIENSLKTTKDENESLATSLIENQSKIEDILNCKLELESYIQTLEPKIDRLSETCESLLESEKEFSVENSTLRDQITNLNEQLQLTSKVNGENLIEQHAKFVKLLKFKMQEKEDQFRSIVKDLMTSEKSLQRLRDELKTKRENVVHVGVEAEVRSESVAADTLTELSVLQSSVSQTNICLQEMLSINFGSAHCDVTSQTDPSLIQSMHDEELEALRTSYGNLEVEFNMAQAENSREREELRHSLYESQQECAKYQSTMVQMKTHYDNSAPSVNRHQQQPNNRARSVENHPRDASKVNASSLSHDSASSNQQIINLKQFNSALSEENGKLKRKLETKVEVLDEINDKIASIASSLSIRRPRVQRKSHRHIQPSTNRNQNQSIAFGDRPPIGSMRGTLEVIGCEQNRGLLTTGGRALTDDTGFGSEYSSSPQLNAVGQDQISMHNLRTFLHNIKGYLEELRDSTTSSLATTLDNTPDRTLSPTRTISSQLSNTETFGSRAETPSGHQTMASLLNKKDSEIQNLRKQLDEREDYIAQRRSTREPSADRAILQQILQENAYLKSQLEQRATVGFEHESKAKQLAQHLEEKYQCDMIALDELQSRVTSVTNLKQREITELEQLLQKAVHENSFLKDELRRLHQKLLDNRRQPSSHITHADMPDIDRNPVAFITQLRNLYNDSP
ncbi:uncharacterized protein LOC142337772 isoform X2 [Convolutriloba macropyga]|uniref:uncharacterized protein LOC142337772 isoform X2 n=1 Tax=Convolutriloba macropyga TaxID=536237 RepID=UPI003F52073F